jgi:hypothetical protein
MRDFQQGSTVRLRGTAWSSDGTVGPAGTIIAGSHAGLSLDFIAARARHGCHGAFAQKPL